MQQSPLVPRLDPVLMTGEQRQVRESGEWVFILHGNIFNFVILNSSTQQLQCILCTCTK